MFIEPKLGNRPQISVEIWGLGVMLLLGLTGISERKRRIERQWAPELVLLGFHIDLVRDSISMPNPKIAGDADILSSPVFDTGNYVLGIRDAQELRGCINHWAYTGRVWLWLTPPINKMLSYADNVGLWVRCDDPEKWTSFWNAVQFTMEIVADGDNCASPFRRRFL